MLTVCPFQSYRSSYPTQTSPPARPIDAGGNYTGFTNSTPCNPLASMCLGSQCSVTLLLLPFPYTGYPFTLFTTHLTGKTVLPVLSLIHHVPHRTPSHTYAPHSFFIECSPFCLFFPSLLPPSSPFLHTTERSDLFILSLLLLTLYYAPLRAQLSLFGSREKHISSNQVAPLQGHRRRATSAACAPRRLRRHAAGATMPLAPPHRWRRHAAGAATPLAPPRRWRHHALQYGVTTTAPPCAATTSAKALPSRHAPPRRLAPPQRQSLHHRPAPPYAATTSHAAMTSCAATPPSGALRVYIEEHLRSAFTRQIRAPPEES